MHYYAISDYGFMEYVHNTYGHNEELLLRNLLHTGTARALAVVGDSNVIIRILELVHGGTVLHTAAFKALGRVVSVGRNLEEECVTNKVPALTLDDKALDTIQCLWEAVCENEVYFEYTEEYGTPELRRQFRNEELVSAAITAWNVVCLKEQDKRNLLSFDFDFIPWFVKNCTELYKERVLLNRYWLERARVA